MTVSTLLDDARARLAGTTSQASLEAQILLCHALGRPRGFLRAWPEFEIDAPVARRFHGLIERRRAGEPIAYIVGEREFWSLPLNINRHALIPRPETELLVELALARIPTDARWTIADIGAGSGAIALAAATERPGCRLIATDVSSDALNVARENAASLHIDNVEFRHGAWLEPLGDLACDMILCNPPYIAEGDPLAAAPELDFEPRDALIAGASGLEALAAVADAAPANLAPGGLLLLEHGFDQKETLAGILDRAGFRYIECRRDLAGHDRVTVAVSPNPIEDC